MVLSEIVEQLLAVFQQHRRWLLMVGTGPSVASDCNLGMGALADHLIAEVPTGTSGWAGIKKRLQDAKSLEQALTDIPVNDTLLKELIRLTGDFVARYDAQVRDAIITGARPWVCEPLLRHLVRGLPAASPRLPVVTPNYDLLMEYTCARWSIDYTSGRIGGVLRRGSWDRTRERFFRQEHITQRNRRTAVLRPVPCVEIVKLHGSINLFLGPDGGVIESDIWSLKAPDRYDRLIAPPGDPKYKHVVDYQNQSFNEAYRAMDAASAAVVVGYGFNDEHIHKRLVDNAKQKQLPVIILTRDPADNLDGIAAEAPSVWVLTGNRTKSGDTDDSATRILNSGLGDPAVFPGVRLWSSDVFAEQILGGM
jgi:hypothetical protein